MSNYYEVPQEYEFPLHHIRSRYKDKCESKLIYMAESLVSIGEKPKKEFVNALNQAIRDFPGNATVKEKTINNWRTEICSLFGLVEDNNGKKKPGLRAQELAEKQDLIEFFKIFLYNFQYPGAHLKPHEVKKIIEAGIHFKPANFIIKLLNHACKKEKKVVSLTKLEICHCIFNDLRCTRDNENVSLTWKRIKENRKNKVVYNKKSDIVRYAGDIVDYMVYANLLLTIDKKNYYLNQRESKTINIFINSNNWYSGYDEMIRAKSASKKNIEKLKDDWFAYVNRNVSNVDFSTDVISLIAKDENELKALREGEMAIKDLMSPVEGQEREPRIGRSAKETGDQGESFVYAHECMRIKLGNRQDLIHLIKQIPNQFAVGYDIGSVELDELKRYIEVKSTISKNPLEFNKFHLTKNEWNAARTTKDRYFIYRLMINGTETKLHVLQNPVELSEADKIEMVVRDGADITFDPNDVGESQELLKWKS